MLQSLRLWNRAVDTLGRLNPSLQSSAKASSESNPFEMTSLKEALTAEQTSAPAQSQPTSVKMLEELDSMLQQFKTLAFGYVTLYPLLPKNTHSKTAFASVLDDH